MVSKPVRIVPRFRVANLLLATSVLVNCSEVTQSDRIVEIGRLENADSGAFDPIFDDVGGHKLHIRFAYGVAACDTEDQVRTLVEVRSVQVTPFYSYREGCAGRERTFIYDATIEFGSGGPVLVEILRTESGEVALDTTVVLN